jgi:DNA polymerase-3 subunit epsilon
MRQVVLDTETTGLSWEKGNRVVEIGCVELVERRASGRTFQRYLDPQRDMEPGAEQVTGLSREFLTGKPLFRDVVDEFLDFVRGSELIIHNADFDVGFLDHELSLLGGGYGRLRDYCAVLDSLAMARERFPGQRNSLDALCKRLEVDNAHRSMHGALLDAQLLTEVYLALTAGQTDLALTARDERSSQLRQSSSKAARTGLRLRLANEAECIAHEQRLDAISAKSETRQSLWRQIESAAGVN